MENIEAKWEALSAKIGESGPAVVEAMKELYSVFGTEIVDWYASLYDPEHGMWYHSKSAQENEPYLPDAESLSDVMGFMQEMGATGGRPCYDLFPYWLIKKLGKFVYELQDEDGYFYHKQWGKEIHNLRKSRDLGTCTRFLNAFGITPKYKLPTAEASEDDGEAYDISKAPVQFRSVENFKDYLYNQMNFATRSYNCGSEISSCLDEIETYGKMHGVDFIKMTMDRLTEFMREDNGIWHPEKSYYGGNGAQKITKIYNWMGYKMPYPDKGIETIMEIIMLDDIPGATVDVYNPWRALAEYIKNKERNGASKEELEALMKKVYAWAPLGIKKSAEKIRYFKQADGALSYSRTCSCATKCGSPCAVPNTAEGDVNGTSCGSSALISSIYDALRLHDMAVPAYTDKEMKRFLSIIEERELAYQKSKK